MSNQRLPKLLTSYDFSLQEKKKKEPSFFMPTFHFQNCPWKMIFRNITTMNFPITVSHKYFEKATWSILKCSKIIFHKVGLKGLVWERHSNFLHHYTCKYLWCSIYFPQSLPIVVLLKYSGFHLLSKLFPASGNNWDEEDIYWPKYLVRNRKG